MPTLTSTKAIAELIDNNQDSIINIVLFSISLELILESFNEFIFLFEQEDSNRQVLVVLLFEQSFLILYQR